MAKNQYILTSLQKSLKVLDVLSQVEDMTLTELRERTGFDNTSLYRMLYTLEHENFVEKTTKSTYHLGTKFITYGEKLKHQYSIASFVKEDMAKLAVQMRQTIYLGTLTGNGKVAFIHREDSPSGVQVNVPPGHATKAINSALGKIQIAELPKKEQKAYLANFSHLLSEEQLNQFEKELEKAHLDGYAIDKDERFKGFGSIAVPIYNHHHICVGSLGIVTVATQIDGLIPSYVPQMKEAVEKLIPKLTNKVFY